MSLIKILTIGADAIREIAKMQAQISEHKRIIQCLLFFSKDKKHDLFIKFGDEDQMASIVCDNIRNLHAKIEELEIENKKLLETIQKSSS